MTIGVPRPATKTRFADTWMLTANVAYENCRDERLQNGGGGEATGPIIIPPSSTKTTFFQRNLDEWAGSAAVKHKPSGLFAMANFFDVKSGDTNVRGFYTGNGAPDMTAWDVQAGIQKKWWAPGETAFWGGYAQVNDGWAPGSNGNGGNLGGIAADSILKPFTFASVGVPTEVVGSEVDRWFLAFDQSIEAAAMHLYVAYEHFNADMDLVTRDRLGVPERQAQERSGVDRRLRRDLYRRPHLLLNCHSPPSRDQGPPFGAVLFCGAAIAPRAASAVAEVSQGISHDRNS